MILSALVVVAVFFGISWIFGAPYPEGEGWRVFAGWVLLAWAVFNIPAFIKGTRGWAKLFLAALFVAMGMAYVNGNKTLLEAMF